MTTLNALSLLLSKLSLTLVALAATSAVYTVSPNSGLQTAQIPEPTQTSSSIIALSVANPVPTVNDIQSYVEAESVVFGINPLLAACLAKYESQWHPDRIGDIGNKNGESYGLFQIEVKQHNDITKNQALDYKTATIWTLEKIAEGHIKWWATYSAKPFYCAEIKVNL